MKKILAIFIQMYLDVVTFIYKLLNLNLKDACLHLCATVCIYIWIFETLLTWMDSQMHYFQQGTLCSQSDASIVFTWLQSKVPCVDQKCVCETYFCYWIYFTFIHIHLCVQICGLVGKLQVAIKPIMGVLL